MEYVEVIKQMLDGALGENAKYAYFIIAAAILYIKNFMATPEQGTLKYKIYRIIVDLPTGTWTAKAKDTGEKSIKIATKK